MAGQGMGLATMSDAATLTQSTDHLPDSGAFEKPHNVHYPVPPGALREAKEWDEFTTDYEGADTVELGPQVRKGNKADAWCVSAQKYAGIIQPEENPRTLGLHWALNRRGPYIRPSHFVGAVWLDEPAPDNPMGTPLAVKPKLDEIDALAMFAAVAEHGEVELASLFNCDPEGLPIPGVQSPEYTLLQVAAYLAALAQFVQRDLRQGFTRVQENLNGRIKGRIRLADHMRENLAFGRVDRAACEFTVMSLDTLENRILNSALEVCGRFLANNTGHLAPQLAHWVAVCRAAFAGVPEHRVTARDWGQTCKTGLMRAYARPLALARMILSRLRADADGRFVDTEPQETIPFFLDMNALFEAWVGVWLTKADLQVEAQKERRLLGTTRKFIPDFVAPGDRIVIDVKYKGIENSTSTPGQAFNPAPDPSDVYQAIAYARLLDFDNQDTNYQEAWLAVPGQLAEGDPLENAAKRWKARQEDEITAKSWLWKDGFRFGVFNVDLPKRKTSHAN